MRRPGTFRTSAAAAPFPVPLTSDMPCGRVVLNTRGDHADADAPPFLGLPLSCRGGEPIPSPVETTGLIPHNSVPLVIRNRRGVSQPAKLFLEVSVLVLRNATQRRRHQR